MRKTNLRQWLASGAAAGALSLAFGAYAQAEQVTFTFDQPAMPMPAALQSIGRETGVNILVDSSLIKGLRAGELKGQLSADDALVALLDGTGLTVRKTDHNSVMIVRTPDPQGASAAGGGAEVEALIVTAQKREEDIQDVPIAISAFTQEDLTRSQVAGGPDLMTQVPNMTFTKTNFSSYSIQLRGIGTQAISATTDPAVAVAFNNTPFIRNRFFEQEFYDLQRVEVLRGPQGTLYGRNATAGVVNIISAKPKFVAEARASADVSNFASSRIEGMVNLPLVEDTVALRIAGAWTKRDGYAENELTGNPIDGRDIWSTRVSLRVAPTDALDVNLIWEHFEEDDDRLRSGKQLCKKHVVTNIGRFPVDDGFNFDFSQGCERKSLYSEDSFQTPNGRMLPYYLPLGGIGLPTALTDPYENNVQSQDLRTIESTLDPNYRAQSDLAELQISFDIGGGLSLSSETAYSADSVYSMQDFNRFNTAPGAWGGSGANVPALIERKVLRDDLGENLVFCDPQLGCSDRLMAVDISTAESWQFSQELRLSSDFEGPFNFSLGANYLRADSEDKYYVFFNSVTMIAVMGNTGAYADYGTYYPGVTDNSDCLPEGYAYGDPLDIYQVQHCAYVDPNPIESVNDQGHSYFLSRNPYKLISYALFGEAYYNLTDNLKLTAGLRYTIDKKDAPRIPTWVLASQSFGYPVAEVIEQDWREPTGRLTIDWKPDLVFTDETLLYASFARGYKAGGANPPGYVRTFYATNPQGVAAARASVAKSETRPRTFEPEFVDAFEIGAKNTLADGRVTLNVAAFYYDYKDYQISEIVDRSAYNRNFDATVWGIEVESDWRVLENLKLGFKGGYEMTRIADGEQAIDLMDRTAGDPNWTLIRPFPTYASSCILPTFLFERATLASGVGGVGGVGGGNASGCELAYIFNYDPVTEQPYQPVNITYMGWSDEMPYLGWDPTVDYGNNNGEGILKPLGGNELPNAPNWTATITADYTLPLSGAWLATLHTDLHWQSESWWRVFNDHEYNRLDEYFTMNLAAIFVNEEAGWNVMAYIKNVTDETAITGAFLNSDDTGLTTNVFLTEPRLYGLRATKTWSGGPLLGSLGARREGPYPLTIELGGQVQRHKAANQALHPSHADAFTGPLNIFDGAQSEDLDWGDGGDVGLTYRPTGSTWSLSAQVRWGETNGMAAPHAEQDTPPVCAAGGPFIFVCDPAVDDMEPPMRNFSRTNAADARVYDLEQFVVGDIGVGFDGPWSSRVGVGLRYARLESDTRAELFGIPNWNIPANFFTGFETTPVVFHNLYNINANADREFEGFGPVVSWESSFSPLELLDGGKFGLDWSVTAGVLAGTQKATLTTDVKDRYYAISGYNLVAAQLVVKQPFPESTTVLPTIEAVRSERVAVPMLGAGLGLSYDVGAFSVGAGYRWERYFDAIDGGYEERQSFDRTIDGPYFKIAVGFGG